MEHSRAFIVLWQRRRWVAFGALIAAVAALLSVNHVGLFPPSLKGRTNVFATASSEILVDTPDSAFADVTSDLDPLEARASVFARFLTSPTAVDLIARKARLPSDAIEAQGPYDLNQPTFAQGPTAEHRSSQIIGEGAVYRLRFENNPILPIVAVFAQAPTKGEAVRLAAAAPKALHAYVTELQKDQHTPTNRRIEIRQLGKATGGVVNSGANIQIATLVFLVVFGCWCLMLIPARTIAQGWREAREADLWQIDAAGSNGNGNGRKEARPRPRSEHEPAG